MSHGWSYRDWRLGGQRAALGDVTFDSTVHCGAGQGFAEIAPGHYLVRGRPGLVTYSWRLHFRLESPGDGREVVLEAADMNHFGQELWQEQAAVVSEDGVTWQDLGLENMEIVPWTPTGHTDEDDSIDDGWHPPYGVRYRLRLDTPTLWFATPTPYTLERSRAHLDALAARCSFFRPLDVGRTHFSERHGHSLAGMQVARGLDHDDKLRVVVIAGEHPSESAGMYAADGLLDELLRNLDLLSDFAFWVVPVTCVDGVAYGRSYHNVDPDAPVARGCNVGHDWATRSQPETRAVWSLLENVRPHCVLNLHNGRHRREYEVCAPPQPQLATLMDHLREHLAVPLTHWRPYAQPGALNPEVLDAGLAEVTLLFETLLLRRLPGCATFEESHRRTGMHILRGLTDGLREIYGKPQMLAHAEPLSTRPVACRAADFLTRLPSIYHADPAPDECDHDTWNFEVNGLPLQPGSYDAWLRTTSEAPLEFRGDLSSWNVVEGSRRWLVLPSLSVPARKLSFGFSHAGDQPPFDTVLIAREGTPVSLARSEAAPYERYVRDTLADQSPAFTDWRGFLPQLSRGGFGLPELECMWDDIVDWVAQRQVLDECSTYHGAICSEEDKYDARDAAAAAACFARRWRTGGGDEWRQRALGARAYAYRSQRREPENPRHDGGFVHMVQGIWGTQFTRLEPPWPGIDGVDTGAIIHQLCSAAETGLPLAQADLDALLAAAGWIAANEPVPGMFLHHEGATHDCQNASAIGFSALARAHHVLAAAGLKAPEGWLRAVERGITHYLEGQEAIGVWPYWFAQVGRRAGAFHGDNIPDHGIGLYHLTRACSMPPLDGWPGLREALGRAARWYLGVARVDGDTIDLDYDRGPLAEGDICFSGFTWCRFTAAAALVRIGLLTGETEPWRHLGLRLMEHVRRKRWQTADPSRAPVVAHAHPEAPLATWCQAVEWDAAMLGEMIDDLRALAESPPGG